ncbi:zinc ABC transporter ATP-binding protein AztA [Pseudarthrobacter sp. J75]|uniref:zinc ABC transporter ATP-binding protein AztA n=1 Tax=unclassified Pseudarthrobacter TaxID=2647000 RepID=UPI002E7FD34B|nr:MULTISPECIES: zinc ABC transporter ATP-binding protein AztA [unclassified Pseudarthrobacter]MEE2522480.1 zinc ABC transporter ATP-binding protein AztA [Pseudarthrobacter sp. J47]MEE2529189.1 zinc ABC transporter ATP-binding protein AztA [Pseudarthrobacter sp. J75]
MLLLSTTAAESKSAGSRSAESLASAPLAPLADAAQTPEALVLRDVWFDHDGVDALCGVSLAVEAGTVTAVAGHNGSGKSTLLGVMAGLLSPRRGTVERPERLRTALVVQRSAVSDRMPLTVRDVVTMGRWAHAGLWRPLRAGDRKIIDASLERVGLAGFGNRPLGSLSGGQRQRTFLAQGLAQQADLLLLDEPTAGLDADSKERIAAILLAEKDRGATIVCVTHDEAAMGDADAVVRLDAGRVVA